MDYWEENGIEKPQSIIVCAACMYKDLLVCGARHFDSVMMRQIHATKENLLPEYGTMWGQGFIDQFGIYHDRDQAMKIVIASGQSFNIERNGDDMRLFSEGLY